MVTEVFQSEAYFFLFSSETQADGRLTCIFKEYAKGKGI